MTKTVIITGCSSGIGKATAEFFADKGWNVAATMRKPSSDAGKKLAALPNVLVSRVDVSDRESIDSAVAETLSKFGSIDVVVNNAGYVLGGPAEFATKAQVLTQLDTNVYGPLAVTQAVLPHFRSTGAGLVVNVSSMVGRFAFPFMSVYVASKHALEGLSEALNLELVPLGVRVKLVEPGNTVTNYPSRMDMADQESETAYSKATQKSNENFAKMLGHNSSSAEDVASVIYDAATDGKDTVRYPVGEDTKMLLAIRNGKTDEEWEKYVLQGFELVE